MIPQFNEDGVLPPGIYRADLDEIATRFGQQSEIRRVEMESVRWLVVLAQRMGAERLIINGSFVTDSREPNDVDCVLLIGPAATPDTQAEAEILAGLPFLQVELVTPRVFRDFVEKIFGTDRYWKPKGMIEVIL